MNAIPEWQRKFQKSLPQDDVEAWDKRYKKPSFQELFKKPAFQDNFKELARSDFDREKAGVIGAAVRFAKDTINDDNVRLSYQQNVERVLKEVTKMVEDGKITSEEGAAWCSYMRNEIMELHREYTSKYGLAKATKTKSKGRPLDYFFQKYSREKFEKDFVNLSDSQKDEVFEEVRKASARPHAPTTLKVKRLQLLGRVMLVASAMLAAYDIYTAENKLKEALKQGIGIGAGIAGGAYAGLMVDPLCGPVAEVCALVTVTVGAFVGGVYGYLTAQMLDDELEELTKWINP
ncbi:unnamed protein product [Commensalibacter communis]|uniref:Uncharacterized protein n=1 Tax=Commensalibacter communis TaxID=2972786 RepID=A0A9W4TP72_9PROT|nr:hypothetical protein [Commensalibacter communis]CAI3939612.1 unnamed protein product [Commensalibacter communis]CAI3940749.1 unnamed protein product [Commensalibacter communis]CAI3943898.1 unnamed protein product [Commensalibacter communis]CAI3945900.1 unnamed protein product [Commensalibacter communis]